MQPCPWRVAFLPPGRMTESLKARDAFSAHSVRCGPRRTQASSCRGHAGVSPAETDVYRLSSLRADIGPHSPPRPSPIVPRSSDVSWSASCATSARSCPSSLPSQFPGHDRSPTPGPPPASTRNRRFCGPPHSCDLCTAICRSAAEPQPNRSGRVPGIAPRRPPIRTIRAV